MRFKTFGVKLRLPFDIQLLRIIPGCDHQGTIILLKSNSFLALERSFGKREIKNEQDFVAAFTLMEEDILNNQRT